MTLIYLLVDTLSRTEEPDIACGGRVQPRGRPPVDRHRVEGRRHIVWALEKLVFRRETFHIAARLLLRLAATETEKFSNNSTGLFKQLFQLHLSGAEAEPAERFAVLDEGLHSDDVRLTEVCISALEQTLKEPF